MVKRREKPLRQMLRRSRTVEQIEAARRRGASHPAGHLETGGRTTRYVHPETGRSVVVDDSSGEVIHVGGDGFVY